MKVYTNQDIKQAAEAFRSHEILAFPTDTVYGVGVMYGSLEDLSRLKNAKKRPEEKPIPLMASCLEQLEQVAVLNENTRRLIQKLLPGPLTLVLPLRPEIDRAYTNGCETIACRIPDNEFILQVINELNTPLMVSSANISGQPAALNLEQAMQALPDIDGYVDGECIEMQPSTIVDCTRDQLKILRPGPISMAQIENVLENKDNWF